MKKRYELQAILEKGGGEFMEWRTYGTYRTKWGAKSIARIWLDAGWGGVRVVDTKYGGIAWEN